jgi:AraC-like DNA-binding protein
MPSSDHLIPYHILTRGTCYAGLVGQEQVEMTAGDVIIFPHGDAHVMASARGLRVGADLSSAKTEEYPFTLHLGDDGPAVTSFTCGFFGCDRRPFNPLLSALPRMMLMRGMSDPWIGTFIPKLNEESRLGRAGAESVLTRMAELMFVEMLRRYLDELPVGQTGWLAGLRDELVSRVLALIHAQPGHPWTLVSLAREAATSRTTLAKRFTELVGQPPMQYLAQWRMQVAASLLSHGGSKVATIGAEVGYDSEAAFSRAFKKSTGVAPGAWRELRRTVRA